MKCRYLKMSIVICTKDRYKDFKNCLSSIQKQEKSPHEVIVIDASINNLTKEYAKKHGLFYIRQNNGGLSSARNLAIKEVTGEIILFLDEDTILDKNYIGNILSTYILNDEVVGVEGFIENYERKHPIIEFFDYLFLLDSPIKGKVLPSGHNTYPNKLKNNSVCRVDWMSGCNMSYRKEVFNNQRFDERFGAVSGKYCAVGEDLDFSYRVSKEQILLMNQKAKLKHLFIRSKELRKINLSSIKREQIGLIDRYSFFKKNIHSTIIIFLWSEIGYFISTLIKHFVKRRNNR